MKRVRNESDKTLTELQEQLAQRDIAVERLTSEVKQLQARFYVLARPQSPGGSPDRSLHEIYRSLHETLHETWPAGSHA